MLIIRVLVVILLYHEGSSLRLHKNDLVQTRSTWDATLGEYQVNPVQESNEGEVGMTGVRDQFQDACKLIMSVAVYEAEAVVAQMLENYLRFTCDSTKVVLHVSANSSYNMSRPFWRDTVANKRVIINPERHATGWCQMGIFVAHMSNALYMQQHCPPTETQGAVFLPMASNSLFFRSGLEGFVRSTNGTSIRNTPCLGFRHIGLAGWKNENINKDVEFFRSIAGRDYMPLSNFRLQFANDQQMPIFRSFLGQYFPLSHIVSLATRVRGLGYWEKDQLKTCGEDYMLANYYVYDEQFRNQFLGLGPEDLSKCQAERLEAKYCCSAEDAETMAHNVVTWPFVGKKQWRKPYARIWDVKKWMSAISPGSGVFAIKRVARDAEDLARKYLNQLPANTCW